jgi:bacterioferritin
VSRNVIDICYNKPCLRIADRRSFSGNHVNLESEYMDRTKSIELLNKAVADELHAVHQYMYFHFHLDDQGFGPLSLLFKRIAIEEMGHVEALAERILFLKGDVEMVTAAAVEKIVDPEAILVKGMAMEEDGIRSYNEAALACAANADAVSKQLFERLVADEERHYDQYEKQRDNIKRFGPSYLALQSFGSASGEPSTPAE